MRRACRWISTVCVGITLLVGISGTVAWAAPQDQAKPSYTLPEYNAYQAAHNETNPANKVKLLDDFVAKYPMSALMPYVYSDYYLAYYAQKNYPKTIEYADKLLPILAPTDLGTRLQALVARSQAFLQGSAADKTLATPEALGKARDAAADGVKTLASWQKPEKMTDDVFATQKKTLGLLFDSITGLADTQLKDFKGAAAAYKAALALDPNDAVSHYHLGVSYLQDKPADLVGGSWELARAIALKAPGDAQIRTYLRSQILNYQQASCDKLVDDEIASLITLAGSSNDRPASLNIPSADDLQKARDDTANFIPWLKEGSDHGKVMWLATCGLEYPDVGVKIVEVDPGDGDNVTLKVYRPAATDPDAASKEMEAATDPNMEVHVTGQPDAKKLMKDDQVRFTGTLTAYSPSPFLLTWENAKVNADDLKDAVATPEPGKTPAKRSAKPAAPKKPAAQ